MRPKTLSTDTETRAAASSSFSQDDIVLESLPRNTFRSDDLEANSNETYDDKPQKDDRRLNVQHADSLSPFKQFWRRFRGEGRRVPGWTESAKNTLCHSWLNLFLIFIPLSWAGHWVSWPYSMIFAFSFLAVIPLAELLDYGGEQMALYLGDVRTLPSALVRVLTLIKSFGDFLSITLANAIEGILAIVLLTSCQLKLLQSTIVGVLLLHLLFAPGMAFLTGGARIREQHLGSHATQLNHSLLTFGVLALLLPAAFFAALPRTLPSTSIGSFSTPVALQQLVTDGNHGKGKDMAIQTALMRAVKTLAVQDSTRGTFLKISRGFAVLMLIAYIGSRVYLYLSPEADNGLVSASSADKTRKNQVNEAKHKEPQINPWFGLVLLTTTLVLTVVTAEWLSGSIDQVQTSTNITSEWFGIVLLPFLGYSADACVTVLYFVKAVLFLHPESPNEKAQTQSIDWSIQFVLFWVPLVVLVGWWTGREMLLLFDLWEVVVLIAACFLVNYVTADAKTNWAEGMVMVLFYLMIALIAWFYNGQAEVYEMLLCGPVGVSLSRVRLVSIRSPEDCSSRLLSGGSGKSSV